MAGIPQNFQSISPIIANYDFVDIASGTGYINFYAGRTVDLKLLSNFTFYSEPISETGADFEMDANYTLEFDYDFDVLLNRPLDISGIGVANIPIGMDFGGGVGHTGYAYVTVKVRKWDGATETDIVSNDSTVWTAATDTTQYHMSSVDLVCPLTHFKKGEYLRLTVMLYVKEPNHGVKGILAADPMNRTTDWDSTGAVPSKLMFQCPVRLNL